jgi:flagellar biosynthesis chaperone FliJ
VKAYRFRLATVARIRVLEERVAADRFRVAQRDLRRAQGAEDAAARNLVLLAGPAGLMTMAEVTWIGEQAERLAATLAACREDVVVAEAGCVEARRHWDIALRRSEVLARLDEQGRVRWRADALRHEAGELDDLSNARHRLVGAGS